MTGGDHHFDGNIFVATRLPLTRAGNIPYLHCLKISILLYCTITVFHRARRYSSRTILYARNRAALVCAHAVTITSYFAIRPRRDRRASIQRPFAPSCSIACGPGSPTPDDVAGGEVGATSRRAPWRSFSAGLITWRRSTVRIIRCPDNPFANFSLGAG